MFEWLKRLFGKRQVEKPKLVSRLNSLNEQFEKHKQRVSKLDRGIEEHIERVKALDRDFEQYRKQREELARRIRPKTPLEALKEANLRNRRRQPASQTYTGRKVRGMPPRSARNKRMWKLQVSKEELDEL